MLLKNSDRTRGVSIILIHGLNGGATKTWQHTPRDGPDIVWFRDHLPSLVKDDVRGTNARIWTFGYSADIFTAASTRLDLTDFVRSLLESVRQAQDGFEVPPNRNDEVCQR